MLSILFFGTLLASAHGLDLDLNVDWKQAKITTRTAATIEVDVMPFLGRTDYGGPFNAYYEAMADLGSEFVRYAPWFPNPGVVVPELRPNDCTASKPATNWNSTMFDGIIRDFMAAVCGPNAAKGECKHSVVQQLSTMPGWIYKGGNVPEDVPAYPWNTTNPFGKYGKGKELVDKTCKQMARHMARIVGWYTAGGFHDECGHWHESGNNYTWWGLSVLNEDEHHIQPDNGEAYTTCYDAVSAEVKKVNPTITLVGPEICCRGPEYLMYFLNASNHADGKAPAVSSYHQAMTAGNASAATFYTQWDSIYKSYVMQVEDFKRKTGQKTEMVLNEFIPFVNDWCDCTGVEHLCGGQAFPTRCPNWQDPATAGNDPNLQHRKGVGMNKQTMSWNAAAGVFAYGFGTLAELGYKFVGQDQLIGGTWPDNEPAVSCMDWQSGQVNAKYWATQLLATTVGDAGEKTIVTYSLKTSASEVLGRQQGDSPNATDYLYAMPYIKAGVKGIMLVNKQAVTIDVKIDGLEGGQASVIEAVGEQPGMSPPVVRSLSSDGTLKLGPFAVAVVTKLQESVVGGGISLLV